MDLQLHGRTALVTGASMGIGRAIARLLAAEGVKTAIVARRGALLEELADEIVKAQGPRPAVVVADLMAEGAPARIREAAIKALGKVEILHDAERRQDARDDEKGEQMDRVDPAASLASWIAAQRSTTRTERLRLHDAAQGARRFPAVSSPA